MDIKDLLISLKRQEANLEHLLSVVLAKQQAIVEGKIEKIEETISDEEKLFKNIEFLEKSRIELLQKFSQRLGLAVSYKNVNEFLSVLKPRLDPKFYNELMQIRNNMVQLVGKINNVNHQNKILITQSINFVRTTIGSLIDARRNSLIDKRM